MLKRILIPLDPFLYSDAQLTVLLIL